MKNILQTATPESCGIHSKDITNFVKAMCCPKENQETHSFMLIRHGKIVFEGYFAPYHKDVEHTLYSVSKSFASIAIGYLVEEGKISIEDNICDYFPELLTDGINPENKKIKIKDLLSMSFGQKGGAVHDTSTSKPQNDAMLYDFFYREKDIECGKEFRYDSFGTYMLSALIKKLTGENITEYITPKLFKPLGIESPYYVKDEIGISIGYAGMRLKMKDLAKVGLTLLNKGKFDGQQIIPEKWVSTMTQKHIDTPDVVTGEDWQEGYCYQLWRGRYNTFRLCGAYGQMCAVMPDYDAVLVVFSGYENNNLAYILKSFYENVMFKMEDKPIEENPEEYKEMQEVISNLKLTSSFSSNSPIEQFINGKRFEIEKRGGYYAVEFNFSGDTVTTTLISDSGNFEFKSGFNKEVFGKVCGTHFLPMESEDIAETMGTACWKQINELDITLRLLGTPTILKVTAEFYDEPKVKFFTIRGKI